MDLDKTIQELRGGTPKERVEAATALRKSRDARAVEALIAALGDDEYVDRGLVGTLLKRWVTVWNGGEDREQVDRAPVTVVHVSEAAEESLSKLGVTAVGPLISALERKGPDDWPVRLKAVRCLGRIGDVQAVDSLITALGDEQRAVREAAVKALGGWNPDPELWNPAVAGIGKRAIEPLRAAAFEHHDELVRAGARQALLKIGDKPFYVFLLNEGYDQDDIKWDRPTVSGPGKWMPEVSGKHGYRLCLVGDLSRNVGPALYRAEARGKTRKAPDCLFTPEARLVYRVNGYSLAVLKEWALDCAEQLQRYRPAQLGDEPRVAIETAREYLRGKTSKEAVVTAAEAVSRKLAAPGFLALVEGGEVSRPAALFAALAALQALPREDAAAHHKVFAKIDSELASLASSSPWHASQECVEAYYSLNVANATSQAFKKGINIQFTLDNQLTGRDFIVDYYGRRLLALSGEPGPPAYWF